MLVSVISIFTLFSFSIHFHRPFFSSTFLSIGLFSIGCFFLRPFFPSAVFSRLFFPRLFFPRLIFPRFHESAFDDTRIYRLWLHIARQLHTLLCECVRVAMSETSFITKEWENTRTARDYRIIPCISWYYTTSKAEG